MSKEILDKLPFCQNPLVMFLRLRHLLLFSDSGPQLIQGNHFLISLYFFGFQTDLLTLQQCTTYYYHHTYQITIMLLTLLSRVIANESVGNGNNVLEGLI